MHGSTFVCVFFLPCSMSRNKGHVTASILVNVNTVGSPRRSTMTVKTCDAYSEVTTHSKNPDTQNQNKKKPSTALPRPCPAHVGSANVGGKSRHAIQVPLSSFPSTNAILVPTALPPAILARIPDVLQGTSDIGLNFRGRRPTRVIGSQCCLQLAQVLCKCRPLAWERGLG